jgi:hypothetical protein
MCGFPRPVARGTSRLDLAAPGRARSTLLKRMPRTILAGKPWLAFRNHGQPDRKTAGRPRYAPLDRCRSALITDPFALNEATD